ncbi:hypothetical protein H8V64_002545 [Enterococcus faecalis]|nr:hypothetical protein [Enterococcus faecalis]
MAQLLNIGNKINIKDSNGIMINGILLNILENTIVLECSDSSRRLVSKKLLQKQGYTFTNSPSRIPFKI